MMTIYNEPNYATAQEKAYDTIFKSNISVLPVSIKKIIKMYPNLHLQKFSNFAKKNNLTINETIELLDSEDGCLWMRDDSTYIILYNDTIENKGRVRFTLAHELGHYILKHNEKSGKTKLSRYSLAEKEYDTFEKEANYFAKRLLAPIPLVDTYLSEWKKIDKSDIEDIFSTSHTVAMYVIKGLQKRYQVFSIVRETHKLVKNFKFFLYKDLQTITCVKCGTAIYKENSYCHICGNILLEEKNNSNFYKNRERRLNSMIYSDIDTNDLGYATTCPRCSNDGIWENQDCCQICGIHLQNKCIGETRNNETDDWGNTYNTLNLNGCQSTLRGDARFCPYCGGNTSYNYQKVLTSWEDELKDTTDKSNKVISMQNQSPSISIAEADMPF